MNSQETAKVLTSNGQEELSLVSPMPQEIWGKGLLVSGEKMLLVWGKKDDHCLWGAQASIYAYRTVQPQSRVGVKSRSRGPLFSPPPPPPPLNYG